MKSKILILMLLLSTISIASAEDTYIAKVQLEIAQVSGTTNTWSAPITIELNKTDSKSLLGVTVNYNDIGNANTMLFFKISGGTVTDVVLTKNQPTCIKGNCVMNGTSPVTAGDIRMTLMDIVKQSTASTITTSSDNVVDLYVLCSTGEKLYLNKDSSNNYNPEVCTSKTGWSSTAEKEIFLYLKRNSIVPVSISIETTGGYKEDILDTNTRKYTIQSNEKYTFNVKTKYTDVWGGDVEKIGIYTIVVTGLGTVVTSSSATPVPTASVPIYDVFVGDMKDVTLVDGEFGANTAFSISKISSDAGKTTWRLSFPDSGIIRANYIPTTGKAFDIDFRVKDKPSPATTRPPANQSPLDSIGGNNTLIVIAVILIIVAGIYYFKVKGSSKGRRSSDETERS